ncbi:MAG: rRNA pseudouridine synthase [Dehalococcoidia bacterium]|nr:MAG: rRNA pseudouridine synthase [Dehalococcoidia bacterium]
MKSESLLKVLTGAGTGSRRKMADAIKQERVAVNGQVVTDFRYPVNMETDRISIDRKPVDLKPRQVVTLMLNKPPGIISTVSDERGRGKVTDLLPEKYRSLRLYPVGRLDKDSTGLLLLTNDGELAYRLTHPRFEYEKEYLVHIKGKLKPEEKRKLARGLKLEDGMTHPAKVREVASSPPFNYSITIHEGRKRQVHRMFESLGHSVLALKRIRIGNLNLGNLSEGKTRELNAQEVRALLNQA